jgi:rhodanese-related sulfurtransferase
VDGGARRPAGAAARLTVSVTSMHTRIEVAELKRLIDDGAQVVEVLPQEEFDAEHVRGAVNIPLKQLDGETTAGLDKSNPVVVYCWDYL